MTDESKANPPGETEIPAASDGESAANVSTGEAPAATQPPSSGEAASLAEVATVSAAEPAQVPPLETPAIQVVIVGALILLGGLLGAMFVSGLVGFLLGAISRGTSAGQYLPLLAVPVFAVAASAWVLNVVYRIGLRIGKPRLGLLSYALLVVPVGLAWLLPRSAQVAPGFTVAVVAGLLPAFFGVKAAFAALNPPAPR